MVRSNVLQQHENKSIGSVGIILVISFRSEIKCIASVGECQAPVNKCGTEVED
jgi:hypothetical protein